MKKNIVTMTLVGLLVAGTALAGGSRVERTTEGGTQTIHLYVPAASAKQTAGAGIFMHLRVSPDTGEERTGEVVDLTSPSVRLWIGQTQNKDTDDPQDFFLEYEKGSCEKGTCHFRTSEIKPEWLTRPENGKEVSHASNIYAEILYSDNHEDAEAKAKKKLRDPDADVVFTNITKVGMVIDGQTVRRWTKTEDGRNADGYALGGKL